MFVKRKLILRSNEEWLKIIEEWGSSQKSIIAWCRENGVSVSSFRSAYKRLFANHQKQPVFQKSCFQELHETSHWNGIELSFQGVTIKVSPQLDERHLLNLLKVLRNLK